MRSDTPPYAPGPAWGHLPQLALEPIQTFESAASHGDIVRLRTHWPKPFYLVSHPDLIERIVETRSENYPSGFTVLPYATVFGPSLVTTGALENKARRRVQAPYYRKGMMVTLDHLIVGEVKQLIDRWGRMPEGEFIDVRPELVALQLRIMGRILFSHNFGNETDLIMEHWKVMMDRLIPVTIHKHTPIARGFSSRSRRTFERSRRVITRLLARILHDRRSGLTAGEDMLTSLIGARDQNGRPWSDEVIVAEMFQMIGGGFETTASTILWGLYRLASHPEVDERLQAELTSFPSPLDWQAVSSSDYLGWTVDEIIRLHPAIHLVVRVAVEEDTLGGYRIPAGSIVGMSIFQTQIDPRWWKEPKEFRPERFDPSQEFRRPSYAYLPFGGGPRACVGASMANVVITLVLANLAREFRFHLPAGFTTSSRNCGWPRDSIRVRLERRTA